MNILAIILFPLNMFTLTTSLERSSHTQYESPNKEGNQRSTHLLRYWISKAEYMFVSIESVEAIQAMLDMIDELEPKYGADSLCDKYKLGLFRLVERLYSPTSHTQLTYPHHFILILV
jgi:hypothetical protein